MELYEQLLAALDECPIAPEDVTENLGWDLHYKIPKLCYHYGATRFCFADPSKNFVLKINFANSSGHFVDYSAREIDRYEKAKEYKVEKALLPTELYYVSRSGIKVYKQAKYTRSINDLNSCRKRHLYNGAVNKNARIAYRIFQRIHSSTQIGELWLQCALQIYGKKFMRSFEEYCLDVGIHDLHTGNVGFIHKFPVLIDYAGYDG